MYAQPLTRSRRLACLTILALASAGGTSASAFACLPAAVFQRDQAAQAAQRVVQQHALARMQAKVAVRVVCSSVYPLSCHASTQK